MRLLRVTDFHFNQRWFDWLAALPSRLCVCSGNHDWWPIPERVVDVNAETAWLKRRRRPGLLVDGDFEVIGGYRFACKRRAGSVAFGEGLPVVL
jgi:predicted phosphohydrolase